MIFFFFAGVSVCLQCAFSDDDDVVIFGLCILLEFQPALCMCGYVFCKVYMYYAIMHVDGCLMGSLLGDYASAYA